MAESFVRSCDLRLFSHRIRRGTASMSRHPHGAAVAALTVEFSVFIALHCSAAPHAAAWRRHGVATHRVLPKPYERTFRLINISDYATTFTALDLH